MADLPRLYLITDRHLLPGGDLLPALEAALSGGVRLVQLREKDLSTAALLRLGRQVKALTDRYEAHLLINSRTDVALALGTGVHLTSDDPPVAQVRALLGRQRWIGVSTHHQDEISRVAADGADFVTFGPVFDTPSKRGMGIPAGLKRLSEVVESAPIPLFALGGIGVDQVDSVMACGGHGIGLISAILTAVDPADASRRLTARVMPPASLL